jgi:O6-methylguanine-DNA--protein-cysteine methyltransferase
MRFPVATGGRLGGMFVIESPIGPLGLVVDGPAVVGVRFAARPGPSTDHPAAEQLRAYFAGELTDFTVPFDLRGGSEFEQALWVIRERPVPSVRPAITTRSR